MNSEVIYRGTEDPHQASLSLLGGTERRLLQVKAATHRHWAQQIHTEQSRGRNLQSRTRISHSLFHQSDYCSTLQLLGYCWIQSVSGSSSVSPLQTTCNRKPNSDTETVPSVQRTFSTQAETIQNRASEWMRPDEFQISPSTTTAWQELFTVPSSWDLALHRFLMVGCWPNIQDYWSPLFGPVPLGKSSNQQDLWAVFCCEITVTVFMLTLP